MLLVSLHSHSGQVLMPQQPLAARTCSWMPPSIAVATVFLQVLTQSNQCGAKTGTVWSQDTPGQLEEDRSHPSHAVICGLQGDGPHFKGGIGKAHKLRQERVRTAEVLITAVCGWVVMMWGRVAGCGTGIVMGIQVVQWQMLAAVATSTQGEVMVVMACGPGGWVMFIGDRSCSAPLANHHST